MPRVTSGVLEWRDDLKLKSANLFFDSRQSRGDCFVSHAHSDHLGCHDRAISTPETAALAEYRIGVRDVMRLEYGVNHSFDADTRLKLLPAGHVLGSAMIHVTRPEGTLLYTGDFKLRSCLTVPQARPERADVLVMESTFGQPFFKFPPWQSVADELVTRVADALSDGRQPIVMGYSLGKSQEIVRILNDAGLVPTLHGAVWATCQIYESLGVPLGSYRRYRFDDFHGPAALDLAERGPLVAPPQVARSSFVTRFKNPLRIMLSGWSLLPNAIYRYGVDHALPLSDHADFNELLELIELVQPSKIFTHHGYKDFANILRGRGHDASLARPDAQMLLF